MTPASKSARAPKPTAGQKAKAASDAHKTVIMTTMRRSQAIRLRNFIRQQEPTAFIMIENSSEIIGRGFREL